MKKSIFIILLFLATNIIGQISYTIESDSLEGFSIVKADTISDNNIDITVINHLDSVGVLKYVDRALYRVESSIALQRVKIGELESQSLELRAIFDQFSPITFNDQLAARYATKFDGTYKIVGDGEIRTAVIQNGQIDDGTNTGVVKVLSEHAIKVKNYFSANHKFYQKRDGLLVTENETETIKLKRQ